MPLEGRYGAMLTVAILALAPFIVVSSACAMYVEQITKDLHVPRVGVEIIAALATAGYAFGALLGGDLVQRFRQRRLFLLCESLFIAGCIMSALARGPVLYGAGRELSGFATGLLLIVALPPVIQNFPASRMPITVVAVNIGFFGAVCAGPVLGGAVWLGHDWRWFYAGLAGLGAIALGLALLTLPLKDPPNPDLPFDWSAVVLALGATVLVFFASAELTKHPFASFRFALPVSLGLICFLALTLTQYHQKQPLSPIKEMWTTLPVIGTFAAMIGGGIFFSFVELAEDFQVSALHGSPWRAGMLLWPLIPAVLVSAGLLGVAIKTRLLPFLILAGMACIVGGGAMIGSMTPAHAGIMTLAAAGLLGFGAGATVAPGLYLAGFSLGPRNIGRIFALVELVRSVFDYVIAPVIIRIAVQGSNGPTPQVPGLHEAGWIAIWIGIAFTVFGVGVYLLGGVGLPRPDLETWLGQGRPAVDSPELLAKLRG